MTTSRSHLTRSVSPCLAGLLLLLLVFAQSASATSAPRRWVSQARHTAPAVAPRAAASKAGISSRFTADPDHDGLSTQLELRRYRTNPRRFDTDGDRYGDGAEVKAGTNPRNPASKPQPPVVEPSPILPPVEVPVAPSEPPATEEPTAPPVTEPPATEEPAAEPPPTEPPATEEPPVTPPPPADTTAPETTISSGPSGSTTATTASIAFGSSESGSSFECRLDGGTWASCASPKAYSGLAVGAHSFAVRAKDAAGNVDATPATREWTVTASESVGGNTAPCSQTLAAGANLSTAIANAPAGSVICLPATATSFSVSQVTKSSPVTVRGGGGTVGYSAIRKSTNLRFENIHFTGGLELLGATRGISIVNNEFTGPFGIHAGGEAHTTSGSKVSEVLIEGNNMHNLDYTGSQGSANGYGITASDGVSDFVIRGNTIKSPASDYIQSASPVNFVVDRNTFLGPSLLGSHQDHQDLWQIFGGGTNVTFTNNVARNTETQESLLFQEGAFKNVVVENNLFDHDSRGYTCQIYQSTGLVFRNNTIVGSHWGCLFRDLASSAPGSGYQVDHNVFVGTAEGSDVSLEGRASGWGTYDYNVSEDGSAGGSHSVRNWKPAWSDATNYVPSGLSFAAGFRP